MPIQISPGKWQRLRSLTDEQGRFKMMAIDQRGSLWQTIANATGNRSEQPVHDDMVKVKQTITKALAPYSTAVLTDPEYGYPYSLQQLPPRVGLLLACEETGYDQTGVQGKGRKTRLLPNWSVEQVQQAGADAVKLLAFYHPDASEDVLAHQHELVQRVGDECARVAMPFLLELVSYALGGESADTADFALNKPQLVIRSAAEFSKSQYNVDILKLEFPANLKWTKEFSNGAFDGRERQSVYTLSQVREFCQEVNGAAGMPWVILSAGVDIEEFLVQVDLTTEAGASGFLCGRAIWKDCISLYPNTAKMEEWLGTEGAHNFVRANAHAQRALPWFRHRRFAGIEDL